MAGIAGLSCQCHVVASIKTTPQLVSGIKRQHRPQVVAMATNGALSSSKSVSPMVFRDESTGIVCYRTETGEVTCEGFDEGPHFHPSRYTAQRYTTPFHLLSKLNGKTEEFFVNGAGI